MSEKITAFPRDGVTIHTMHVPTREVHYTKSIIDEIHTIVVDTALICENNKGDYTMVYWTDGIMYTLEFTKEYILIIGDAFYPLDVYQTIMIEREDTEDE